MTPADQARAMGDYIREHGFSPEYQVGDGKCGCFLHALSNVTDDMHDETYFAVCKVIGVRSLVDEDDLIAAGYASDADRSKAVEACYAAARMLEQS